MPRWIMINVNLSTIEYDPMPKKVDYEVQSWDCICQIHTFTASTATPNCIGLQHEPTVAKPDNQTRADS
jgi:hypothetical protein